MTKSLEIPPAIFALVIPDSYVILVHISQKMRNYDGL